MVKIRKGQYFIIGAVALCFAIAYILLSQYAINIEVGPSDKNVFDNIKDGFPNVVNIILQENKTTPNLEEDMRDYIKFLDDAIAEIASLSALVNERAENIGARRLYTIMERLLDEISFEAPDIKDKNIVIDAKYVREKLVDVVEDEDISKYIL